MHHLLDVEVDLLPGPRLQLALELLEFRALPPMMIPGRAVCTVIRARLAERLTSIREIPAW
jgi:hypothetical protein